MTSHHVKQKPGSSWLSFYCLFVAIIWVADIQFGANSLWSGGATETQYYVISAFSLLIWICLIGFSQVFLNTTTYAPHLHDGLSALLGLFLLSGGMIPFREEFHAVYYYLTYSVVFFLFGTALYCWRRRRHSEPSTGFRWMTNLTFIIGGVTFYLLALEMVPKHGLAALSIQWGGIIPMGVFAWGLSKGITTWEPAKLSPQKPSLSYEPHKPPLKHIKQQPMVAPKEEANNKAISPYHSLHMRTLAERVVKNIEPLIGHKPVQVVNLIDPSAPLVTVNEDDIQKVMNYLLWQALMFTPEGWITISSELRGAYLAISISDTGHGIPIHYLNKMMNARSYHQGTITHKSGDPSLEWATTKQRIEEHGGYIELESDEEVGTSVVFTMPLAQQSSLTEKSRYRAPKKNVSVSNQTKPTSSVLSPLPINKSHILERDNDPAILYLPA